MKYFEATFEGKKIILMKSENNYYMFGNINSYLESDFKDLREIKWIY